MPASADYSQALPEDLGPDSADAVRVSTDGAAGLRVDKFLAGAFPDVSRSRIQQWIALGAVWCDERALLAKTRLSGQETLWVQPLPRDADRAFEPDPVALDIVAEDSALLVLNKPAGLVVHPAAGNWRNTILNGLLFHRPDQAKLPRAGIVHRLDKDTSGLMVVGKTEAACVALTSQLADRSMSRRYLALVAGKIADSGAVDAPIGRDPRHRTRMAVVAAGAGRPAATRFRCLARGTIERQAIALIECALGTGRTHQIRVHMKHIGHPLLGDAIYQGPALGITRQALHAWSLGLRDPLDATPRYWHADPPDDLQAAARAGAIDLPAQLLRLRAEPVDRT